MDNASELEVLYQHRFSAEDLAPKHATWKALCTNFFQKHIRASDRVVDIGAGYCEFINNIHAREKIAVDLNPDIKRFAAPEVRVINTSCTDIQQIESSSVDVVFMSNFLEHLPSKAMVLDTFREAWRILSPRGKIIVLQPNIRFLPGEYWDFFDHHTPLTDRSLVEALRLAGFEPTLVLPKFLPYTTKSRLPKGAVFLRLYLRLPLAWQILGKQALVVAEKSRG